VKENFALALGEVLQTEGGYSDDPRDPGGATSHGITQHEYDHWRAEHGESPRDVRQIDPNEIEAIYRSDYWNPIRGDDLPSGVDYCAFDFAVNSSPLRAARFLQRAAGAVPDGVIGPMTLAAVGRADPQRLIEAMCDARLDYLQALPTWPHFGRGWASRVVEVKADAEGMA
jgi:lysozyme family protein